MNVAVDIYLMKNEVIVDIATIDGKEHKAINDIVDGFRIGQMRRRARADIAVDARGVINPQGLFNKYVAELGYHVKEQDTIRIKPHMTTPRRMLHSLTTTGGSAIHPELETDCGVMRQAHIPKNTSEDLYCLLAVNLYTTETCRILAN